MVNEIKSDGYVLMKDMWLRGDEGVILRTPGVLWVIAGREKLKWGENDKDWEETLEQHRLGDLAFNDADEFLKEAGILDNNLREQIYKITNGTPVYLDLCVSTYEDLKRTGQEITINKFGETKEELVERYVRYMDNQTREIVYMLAQLGNWNDEIVYEVGKKVIPNFSIEKYETIKKLSFVYENDGEYYIHKTIEEVLNKKCPRIIIERNSKILSKYLQQKIINTPEGYRYLQSKFNNYDRLYVIIARLINDDNLEQIIDELAEIREKVFTGKANKIYIKSKLLEYRYGKTDRRTLQAILEEVKDFKYLRLHQEEARWAEFVYKSSLEQFGEDDELTLDAKLWYLMAHSDLVEDESYTGEYEYQEEKHKKYLDMAKETYQKCLNKYGRNNKYTIKALYMWLLFEPDDDTFFNITMEIYKSCRDTFGITDRHKIECKLDTINGWHIPFKECAEMLEEQKNRSNETTNNP